MTGPNRANQKYFDILNVSKSSSSKEIKESFLKLSKIYHPDNKLTGSHSQFVKLKEAYDAVKDGQAAKSFTSENQNYKQNDFSHRSHAFYRETHRDYPQNRRPFGGPFGDSSSPWEELRRNQEARRRQMQESAFVRRAGRPLIHTSLFFGAIAWIIIYSSVLMIWDYKEQMKRGLVRRHARIQADYQVLDEYYKRKAAEKEAMLASRKPSPDNED